MTTHMISALLGGHLDPDLELQLAARLPIALRRVELSDERAPDYRIDVGCAVEFGFGWSRTTARSDIPYIAIIVEHPQGTHVSGVAWQSPEYEGRWFAQFQSVTPVTLHS